MLFSGLPYTFHSFFPWEFQYSCHSCPSQDGYYRRESILNRTSTAVYSCCMYMIYIKWLYYPKDKYLLLIILFTIQNKNLKCLCHRTFSSSDQCIISLLLPRWVLWATSAIPKRWTCNRWIQKQWQHLFVCVYCKPFDTWLQQSYSCTLLVQSSIPKYLDWNCILFLWYLLDTVTIYV